MSEKNCQLSIFYCQLKNYGSFSFIFFVYAFYIVFVFADGERLAQHVAYFCKNQRKLA